MNEIKELDNKYLILKWEDIKNQSIEDEDDIKRISEQISYDRIAEGKNGHPRYLVLKLDDKFDFQEIISKHKDERFLRVKDIAVDLVNAILKAK